MLLHTQAASGSVALGSHVWVEDPDEAWLDGEVGGINGDEITVNCTSGKTVVAKTADVYPKDPEFPPAGVDDMTKLAYLHEPGVLQNLRLRFDLNEIYTYTGNILIAVNPFKRLPNLYDGDMMNKYKGAAFGELSPHPFAIADTAYRYMVNEGKSQAILVSGESGAGKTESTKMLMRYLAFMGGRAKSEERSVEQKVLESNPVLEAFGNAKTVRNNNSSRFGKFVELQFDHSWRISGAAIRTYLLERSRVCQVSDPERNYHCFYMLCAAPSEDVEKYKLGKAKSFHYLNQSNCIELDGLDDAKEYIATRNAMDIVGINTDEQDAIFRVVAAILHLGNVEFAKGADADSSEPKDESSRTHLQTVAELFMCNEKNLEDSLCKRVIVTRDESITKNLDPEAATLNRDALAKTVYSRLFDWIVNKINSSIGQDTDSRSLIGVLDIYGFESFKTNSFEQFCINLTNEKLQQHFNQHVFKMEQEEYTREEIDWSYIEFVDNQDILDLIEKKPGGIIALLDEACMFPRSTFETFAEKLYQTFKDNKRFSKPKLSRTDFTINHYAGEVTYQTELFLDKNKDYVIAEHQDLLSASNCSFVSSLFPPLPEDSAKSSKFSSIGSRFKQQLQTLLETLNATEPHYVRCVKPNNLLKPAIFESSNILLQLRCGGVMEAIRISCAGYPTRKTFFEFIDRFRILAPDASSDEVAACKNLLEKSNLKGYQIGKTKVFLRAGQMAELDAIRAEVLGRSACIIQKKVRSYLARKKYLLLQQSSIQIQALCRGQVARYKYECMRREAACVNIQKNFRRHTARKTHKNLLFSAISIQTGMRGMVARGELHFRRQERAATMIESQCRKYLAQRKYLGIRQAAIVMQCACRAEDACRIFRKLKMAAKEAGALKDAKEKLEKDVEELKWQLQQEKQKMSNLEEAKAQEIENLQSALQEMESQYQETKELLSKEREAAEELAEQIQIEQTALEEERAEESAKLQSSLQEMERQLEETKELLQKEREKVKDLEEKAQEAAIKAAEQVQSVQAELQEQKGEETAKLQNDLQEIERRFEETKELLMKEREAAEKAAEQLQTVQAELEAAKAEENTTQKADPEEAAAKDQEISKLQSDLEEAKNQLEETKALLEKEREVGKKVVEQVRIVLVTFAEGNYLRCGYKGVRHEANLGRDKDQDNATSQSDVQELERRLEETKELLRKEREATQNMAEQGNLGDGKGEDTVNLQSAFEETKRELEETKELLKKEREAAKKSAEHIPNEQGISISEQLPTIEVVSIAEQVANSPDASVSEQQPIVQEASVSEQLPIVHDGPITDELANKITAENHNLKGLVSSLEKRIEETEKKYEETLKLCEERLKQATDAESKMIELKTHVQSLQEKVSDMETEDQVLRKEALLNSTSRRMSGHLSFSGAEVTENGQQEQQSSPQAKKFGSKKFGSESMRKSQIERYNDPDNSENLAYWLSNTSTLLFLLQRSLKSSATQKPPQPTSLFGRMTQGFRSSSANISVGTLGVVRQVEAKYPALLFKQQLTAYVETIFGIVRDNLKKELTPLISSCIEASKTSTEAAPADNWQDIVNCLNKCLSLLKENFVPPVLVQTIITQIFSYMNVQIFNSLLVHRECCTFKNGEFVKSGLAKLETWCSEAKEEYAGTSWDELKQTRQAVGFLVMQEKSKISYDEITTELCPVLGVQQLYRICTLYWDDDPNASSISPDVIASMKLLMTDESDDATNTFQLDENPSIPFSVDDICSCLKTLDYSDVKAPADLQDNPDFQFLQLQENADAPAATAAAAPAPAPAPAQG
ncbi:hypothetical protein ACFE04_016051 [Oxalis oulophora]